jgi:hypothetical protein
MSKTAFSILSLTDVSCSRISFENWVISRAEAMLFSENPSLRAPSSSSSTSSSLPAFLSFFHLLSDQVLAFAPSHETAE